MKFKPTNAKISILALAVGYALAYHLAYILFVYPVWEYAHYSYNAHSLIVIVFAYAVCALPVLWYKNVVYPSNIGAVIIYIFLFSPGVLTAVFMWNDSYESLFFLLVSLFFSMILLFYGGFSTHNPSKRIVKKGIKNTAESGKNFGRRNITKIVDVTIVLLTLMSIALIVLFNIGHMRLVGFSDALEIRYARRAASVPVLVSYLTLWLQACFLPYLCARALLARIKLFWLLALISALSIYASSGAKIVIFIPVVVVAFWYILKQRKNILQYTLIAFSFLILILLLLPDSIAFYAKSIFFVRTLSTGGWTLVTYYEQFVPDGLTYFTHIGVVNKLIGLYPHGSLSLGQVIGIRYSGSSSANFSANFWSSDGIAALGIVGIPVVTIVLFLYMRYLNYLAMRSDIILVSLWSIGFWMILVNAPFATSLLSGGGILIIYLLGVYRMKMKYSN